LDLYFGGIIEVKFALPELLTTIKGKPDSR